MPTRTVTAALTLLGKQQGLDAVALDRYTSDPSQRTEITGSPLRETLEQPSGLPEAPVFVGGADVLRDGGEADAAKLRQAGVAEATLWVALPHVANL